MNPNKWVIKGSDLPPSLPTLKQLVRRLEPILGTGRDVTAYRSTTPKYAREHDITSGVGSRLHGGRWNPPGIAAVYASLTPETAMEETLAHYRYYGIPIHTAMPRTFVALRVKVSNALDLTDGNVRQRLQISENRLLETDWRSQPPGTGPCLTQLLGAAAVDAGLECLVVRSAADENGRNIIAFPENLLASSWLQVLAPEKLQP